MTLSRATRHSTAGFTLIELTITTVIVAWILLLVSQILLQSTRLTQATVDSMLRANLELTEAHLRRDAEAAMAVSFSPGWTTEALTLHLREAKVQYTLVDGHLTREHTTLHGEPRVTTTQTLAPLIQFRWYSADSAHLWVEWSGAAPTRSNTRNPGLTRVEIGLMEDRKSVHRLFLASRQRSSVGW